MTVAFRFFAPQVSFLTIQRKKGRREVSLQFYATFQPKGLFITAEYMFLLRYKRKALKNNINQFQLPNGVETYPKVQLNEYETVPYFLQSSQKLTAAVCLLFNTFLSDIQN